MNNKWNMNKKNKKRNINKQELTKKGKTEVIDRKSRPPVSGKITVIDSPGSNPKEHKFIDESCLDERPKISLKSNLYKLLEEYDFWFPNIKHGRKFKIEYNGVIGDEISPGEDVTVYDGSILHLGKRVEFPSIPREHLPMFLNLYGDYYDDENWMQPDMKDRFEQVLEQVLNLGDPEKMLDFLKKNILLRICDIEGFYKLIHQFQNNFQVEYYSFTLHMFGSSFNGLGFKESSDIDLWVKIVCVPDDWAQPSINEKKDVLKSINFKILKNENCGFNPFIQKDNETHPVDFRTSLLPISSKNPEIKIDLVFKEQGVDNSILIQELCIFEPRFRVTCILLRLFAVHHLDKNWLLSKYALTCINLYYFQTLGILPPIEALYTKVVKPNGRYYFDKKSGPISEKFTPKNQEMTVKELLTGFFKFFGETFVFSTETNQCVICPYEGTIYQKEKEDEPSYGNPNLHQIWVRDPFEHWHNIVARVTIANWEKIRTAFRTALQLKILTENTANTFPGVSSSDSTSLLATTEIVADKLNQLDLDQFD